MIKKIFVLTIVYTSLIGIPPGNQQTRNQQPPRERQTQNPNPTQSERQLNNQRRTTSVQRQPSNQTHNQQQNVQQRHISENGTTIIHNHSNHHFTINVPVSANATNSPQSSIENNSNSTNSTDANIQVENENTAHASSESHANAMALIWCNFGSPEQWKKSVADFFARNKKRFFIGGIASLYGTIFYHVIQGNHYLKNGLRWSVWHKEIPLKKLRTAPYYKLTAELVCSAQKRYLSPHDPINFSAPLSTFMQELEKEEQYLHFYQKLYRWCSRLWIRRLFPFNVKLYKKIGIRLRRIRFLRRRFIKWVTEYKMEQNKTFERAVKLLHTKPVNI